MCVRACACACVRARAQSFYKQMSLNVMRKQTKDNDVSEQHCLISKAEEIKHSTWNYDKYICRAGNLCNSKTGCMSYAWKCLLLFKLSNVTWSVCLAKTDHDNQS